MKRLFCYALAAVLAAAAYGCGAPPRATEAPVPTAVVMPTAGDAVPSAAGEGLQTPAEEFEAEQPEPTPWPEPDKVDYTGPYAPVATDAEPARYPSMKLGSPVQTTWGSVRLPQGWTVQDAEGQSPIFADAKGRPVGMICQVESHTDEPYFSLTPEWGALITWETPDYPIDARAFTLESDFPSAAEADRKTIVRAVCLITDGPLIGDDGGAYFLATCLYFDKAYVGKDNKIEYVISNKTIDEIAKSFTVD